MTATIEKKELVIRVPLHASVPSKSGNSRIVAGTGGFTKTTLTVEGKPVSVSVNAIIAP